MVGEYCQSAGKPGWNAARIGIDGRREFVHFTTRRFSVSALPPGWRSAGLLYKPKTEPDAIAFDSKNILQYCDSGRNRHGTLGITIRPTSRHRRDDSRAQSRALSF